MNFLSFFFYQYITLSCRAVDGCQIYSRGLVVIKALLIGREISPTPSLIFRESQKVQNLASFSTSLNFEPLTFENAARYLNSATNFLVAMIADCLCQVWWSWVHAPLRTVVLNLAPVTSHLDTMTAGHRVKFQKNWVPAFFRWRPLKDLETSKVSNCIYEFI